MAKCERVGFFFDVERATDSLWFPSSFFLFFFFNSFFFFFALSPSACAPE